MLPKIKKNKRLIKLHNRLSISGHTFKPFLVLSQRLDVFTHCKRTNVQTILYKIAWSKKLILEQIRVCAIFNCCRSVGNRTNSVTFIDPYLVRTYLFSISEIFNAEAYFLFSAIESKAASVISFLF